MRYPNGYDPQIDGLKMPKPKRRKYLAKPTKANGIQFDSKVEADYYRHLLHQGLRDGVDFKRQVSFVVFDGKKGNANATKPRKRTYKTDFAFYKHGQA